MNDSPDRNDVDRATLDATARLRARLAAENARAQPTRKPAIWPWMIAGGLFVFTAGMLANPLFERTVRGQLPFLAAENAHDAEIDRLGDRLAKLEKQPGATKPEEVPDERLVRTETGLLSARDLINRDARRIDTLTKDIASLSARLAAEQARREATTGTAEAAAARAEAMLTLVMVRSALADGRPLGALEGALNRLFGATQPQVVAAITAVGERPPTRDGLAARLDAFGSALGQRGTGQRLGWWQALGHSVSALVGSADDPVLLRVADAQARLASGDLAAATAQVRRLPAAQRRAARGWLDDADRLLAAERALATLEAGTLDALASPVLAPVTPASNRAR